MLGLSKKKQPPEQVPAQAARDSDQSELSPRGRSRRDLLAGTAAGALLLALSRLNLAFGEADPAVKQETAEERKMRLLYGVDKKLQGKIDVSIDSGVRFLLSRYDRKKKSFPSLIPQGMSEGHHLSLIVYTLLACGVDPDHKVIKGAMRSKKFETLTDHNHINYGRAVHVLCHAAHIDAVTKKYTDPDTGRLKKGGGRIRKSKAAIKEQVAKMIKSQAEHAYRYPGGLQGTPSMEDMSATQYVLLAFQAAQRVGVKVPVKVFERTLPYLIDNQEKGGEDVNLVYWNDNADSDRYGKTFKGKKVKARGWSYVAPNAPGESEHHRKVTGSMTAAGLACTAIIKEALVVAGKLNPRNPAHKDKLKPIDDAINSGWAKLGQIFTPSENPGSPVWQYYWLYGVERVGAFLGVPNMGERKWYKEGAEYLIGRQTAPGQDQTKNRDAGSWPEGGAERQVWRTCFALLFLKRSTKPPAVPVIPPTTTD